jgi:ABC-type Fe3+/spermidine/putrescine transport system ATPase subunit
MALELRSLKKTYRKGALANPKGAQVYPKGANTYLESTYSHPKSMPAHGDFSVSLDFSVAEGETLALVGPSGSGKTTTLNLIAGLEKADSGKVISNGEDISALPSWERNVSVVFQDLALFPHLDVGGNIAYGLFIRKVPKKERQRIIEETLRIVRLPGFASRRIHTLSGGERQRVAIARSLASSPRALLLDEPFSSLDAPLRRELRREFLEIRSHSKAPCVFVTHDREEAVMLGDRLALMTDGRIVETGTGQDLFLSPKTEFTARFFGAGLVLPCKVIGKRFDGITEALTPLGLMAVPSVYGANGTDVSHQIAKLFIPNDAFSLEESRSLSGSGKDQPGWKSYKARCSSTYFNGQNSTVRLLFPDGKNDEGLPRTNENDFFEIIQSPRAKNRAPGSMVTFWVDQSLLRFVESELL